MTEFSDIISESCMHIYHSALLLVPKSSVIWESYGRYAIPIAGIVDGPANSWDSSISTAKQPAKIATATWSPGGTYIAITWEDSMTVAILDPVTLTQYYAMDCPSKGAKVTAFSPDDRSLSCCGTSASSSSDNFLAIWDTRTGGRIGTWECGIRSVGDPSSITYSTDGKMIAVTFPNQPPLKTSTICVYDPDSGSLVWRHSPGKPLVKLWSHDKSFRFATADKRVIDVQEVGGHILYPNSVDTLTAPVGWNPLEPFNFSPTLCRLAYSTEGSVRIWDARNGKSLLDAKDAHFCGSAMTFSSNGFFACGTTGPNTYLWKESVDRYTLYQRFTFGTPLFAPDGASLITWGSSTIRLWPLGSPSTLTPHNPTHIDDPPEHWLLDFIPGRGSVVVARRKSKTVAVSDLKTRVLRLTIDAGMEIYGLRVFGDTLVVEGLGKFITWKLPEGGNVPGIALSVEDSVRTIMVGFSRFIELQSTSISPDPLQVATCGVDLGATQAPPLRVYDVATSGLIATIHTVGDMVWFSQDGNQV